MAKAINPATMMVLDEFVAVGTHGRIERPGKSLQYFPCSTIDGPIVRLKNKDVVYIDDVNTAKKYLEEIDKVLFLGDMLISVGDFRKSGHPLVKAGYVREEWIAEMEYLEKTEKISRSVFNICKELYNKPNPYTSVALSQKYELPLFPKYLAYYELLDHEELKILIRNLRESDKIFSDEEIEIKKKNFFENIKDVIEKAIDDIDIIGIGDLLSTKETQIIGFKIEYNKEIKNIFEKIGLPHKYLE